MHEAQLPWPGMIRSTLALTLACIPLQVLADVYVWTDADGRRQISDSVPAKYRAKAKKVDVPDMPAPPAEDLRSAASGGTAPPSATMDCEAQWQRYQESSECLAFYEYALRGFDADPRANCPIVPQPQGCAPPPMGISSR
jgi:hypothetical protein